MTPDEYERFLALVRRAAGERGMGTDIRDGALISDGVVYGLHTPAQLCRAGDDWPAVIGAYFDQVGRVRQGDGVTADFEGSAPLLRARLVDASWMRDAHPIVRRPLADGLDLALAIKLPEAITYVKEEDAMRWGRAADELLELGLAQVRELEEAPEPTGMRAGDGTVFGAMFGDSMFTSAHALWVDDGMVAVPNRHAVLFHHLKSEAAIAAVGHLITLGREMYEDGPGSISDQLYWKQGDRFTRLPVLHREEGFDFHPPEDFRQVLESLAAG